MTQQISQKLNSNEQTKQLDYNVVTGDTPTFYAGSSSSDKDEVQPSASGGLFSSLPSLPSILETIGSISNLKLPNIGLKMNWANFPIGRVDTGDGLSAKVGVPASDQARGANGGMDPIGPPLFIQGPNGPIINPEYIQSHAIPNLSNAEKIYPSTILEPGRLNYPSSQISPTIKFPEDNSQGKRSGPNPDSFRFPDDPPKTDMRGHDGFPFLGPMNIDVNQPPTADRTIHQRIRPLPSVINVGPGENSGTPFFPGLSRIQPHNSIRQQTPSHIIGGRPGHGTVSKVNIQRDRNVQVISNLQENKRPIGLWSNPEVINPHSGVSLYQPSEQFKPYHPQHINSPITIITPPNSHSPELTGLVPPKQLTKSGVGSTSLTRTKGVVGNIDVLSNLHSLNENPSLGNSVPVAPELIAHNKQQYDITPTTSSTTLGSIPEFYPDYDYAIEGLYSTTKSVQIPEYIQTTMHGNPSYFETSTEIPIKGYNNDSSGFPLKISDDDTPSIKGILDLLYAAEKEVQQQENNYDPHVVTDNKTEHQNILDQNLHSVQPIESDLSGQPWYQDDDISHLSNSEVLHEVVGQLQDSKDSDSMSPLDVQHHLTSDGSFHPIHPKLNLPLDRLPPVESSTVRPMSGELDFIDPVPSITQTLMELTQRPPTIYGNIRTKNNGVVISPSQGNIGDFVPPPVGKGVSIVFDKSKSFLDDQLTDQDDSGVIKISPELPNTADVIGANLEEKGLAGIDALEATGHVENNFRKQLPTIAPEDFEDYSLFRYDDPTMYETIRYGGFGGNPVTHHNGHGDNTFAGVVLSNINRAVQQSINNPNNVAVSDSPPPLPTQPDYTYKDTRNYNLGLENQPLPVFDQDHQDNYDLYQGNHPSSQDVLNINEHQRDMSSGFGDSPPPPSTTPDYTYKLTNEHSLRPPLTPALAPPHLDSNSPAQVSLRQLATSEQVSNPKTTFRDLDDKPRFGTLETESIDGVSNANEKGTDWYYNNYYKDYGNGTDIPVGGNKLAVENSGSRVFMQPTVLSFLLIFALLLFTFSL